MKLYIFIDFQTLDQAVLLLSNVEFFKKLVSLLDGSESYHQIMVLKLFSYLLSYGGCLDILLCWIYIENYSETIHDEFISYNILQKSLAISQSPNIDIGQAALSCFNYFLTYSEYFHITFIGIIIL